MRYGLLLSLVSLLTCVVDLVDSTLPMRPLPPPQGQQCPEMCHTSGTNPANWTVVAGFDQLSACPRPLLLEFSLDIPTTENQFIHTCDAWGTYYYYKPVPSLRVSSEEDVVRVVPHLAWSPAISKSETGGLRGVTVVKEIQSHLQRASPVWNKTILFGGFGGATVGVYIGENMMNPSVADVLFEPFIEKIRTAGIGASKAALLQVCGQNRTGDQTFGVIAAGSNDFSIVQAAVKLWANATCVDISTYAESSDLESVAIRAKLLPVLTPSNATSNITASNSARMAGLTARRLGLNVRAECTTTSVISGDTCESLASKCGILPSDFTKYNSDSKLCSTLKEGQHVCCSSGTLPDFTPKPNSDGSCAVYETISGDSCSAIAARNSLEVDDLEDFNKETWGKLT